MRSTAAARRYARALFALARESSRTAKVKRDLDDLAKLFAKHAALRDALFRPIHPAGQRRRVFEAIAKRLKTSPTVRRFCAVLIDHRRLGELPEIRAEFERLVDEAAGRVRAQVQSASPLRAAQKKRLQAALSARTGRDVEIEVAVDPLLIGGVVARVGDLVFDGSLRSQLERLQTTLTRGR
jgi:F-type H+-transporting ATPase subunit delta